MNNVFASWSLICITEKTESKILEESKSCGSNKLDITRLHEKVNALPYTLRQYVSVCRLCLNFIPRAKIFLFRNDFNILSYNLLIKMLEYCSISVVSKKLTL